MSFNALTFSKVQSSLHLFQHVMIPLQMNLLLASSFLLIGICMSSHILLSSLSAWVPLAYLWENSLRSHQFTKL